MSPLARKRLAWVAVFVAVAAAAAFAFRFSSAEVRSTMSRAVAFCRDAGPLPFFTAMALLPAVGFPLAPFVLGAGPAFAPRLGIGGVVACALLAVAANVALSYWIAARLLRPLTMRLVVRLGYRLPVVTGNSAFFTALALRLVPGPPFFLQSYLLGLARVPFGTYMAVSVLVPSAYLVATIVLADALARRDPWAVAAAAGIFVVTGGVLHQVRRRLQTPRPAPSAVSSATVPHSAERNDIPAR